MTFAGSRMCLVPPALSICSIALLLGSAPVLAAQDQKPSGIRHSPQISALIGDLEKTKLPKETAISPNGTLVAWTANTDKGTQLHLTDLSRFQAEKDLLIGPKSGAPACAISSLAWSPDEQSLAFISNCAMGSDKPGQDEVFLWSEQSGNSKQLTHLTGGIDALAWSPDGKSLGLLYIENATRNAGATAAMKPWAGVIGEDGIEIQRVAVVDPASGVLTPISPASLHVYEFDWSPDSKRVVFVAANPPGENNWWIAQMYTQGLTQTAPKSILNTALVGGSLHNLQIAVPRWSPDGKQIAFIGGLMSDQGETGGDIYLLRAEGGEEPKDITPGRAASAAYIGWVTSSILGVAEHVGGSSHITALNTDTAKDIPQIDSTFPETIGAGQLGMRISISHKRTIAIIRSSFDQAPEVWAGPVNNLKQITHLNDGLKPAWGRTEDVEWTNDGFKVQGWLLYPVNYDPAKKYPLLVDVHGGPSSTVTPSWPGVGYGGVPFSGLGYFVFMPNPRGSFGQGEKFTQANIQDFGYGDLRDILSGMDSLEKRLPIDKNREGLTGWSYGGFMTMFGVTQTNRFKAAVAGAGISDWKSYYGENSIDQWMVPFFGSTVYDDPAIYAKSSAIEFIKNVKTPTLIVVGDRDGECPAPQSFEFWHALRARGVRTQLVVYPNEGHWFRDTIHRKDVLERALNWFETEMPAQGN